MAIEKDITKEAAYRCDNLGETKPKILIGGETGKFVPNVNFSYALDSDSEKYFINLNRSKIKVDKEKESILSKKLSLSVGSETDIWHVDEEGNFKWDIEFSSKPETNVFEWDLLHSEGLSFYYQPPLTQAEIIEGKANRPDNVVGSYAVYCDRSGHLVDAEGKTQVNYRSGKVLHIFRPLCKDNSGKEEWADLLIKDGTLKITIPQKFLDDARYPVLLDPDFGNTGIGASAYAYAEDNWLWRLNATPAGSGSLTSIKMYSVQRDGSPLLNPAIYSDSSGDANARLAYVNSGGTSITSTAGWFSTNISYASIAASTTYWMGNKYVAAQYWDYYYDAAGAGNYCAEKATAGDWAATWTMVDEIERIGSIYGTYTASGAGRTTKNTRSFPLGIAAGMNRRM